MDKPLAGLEGGKRILKPTSGEMHPWMRDQGNPGLTNNPPRCLAIPRSVVSTVCAVPYVLSLCLFYGRVDDDSPAFEITLGQQQKDTSRCRLLIWSP
jgi:hypothetical protein